MQQPCSYQRCHAQEEADRAWFKANMGPDDTEQSPPQPSSANTTKHSTPNGKAQEPVAGGSSGSRGSSGNSSGSHEATAGAKDGQGGQGTPPPRPAVSPFAMASALTPGGPAANPAAAAKRLAHDVAADAELMRQVQVRAAGHAGAWAVVQEPTPCLETTFLLL